MGMKLVFRVAQVVVYDKHGTDSKKIDIIPAGASFIVYPETTRSLFQVKEYLVLTPRGILGWAVV